MYRSSKYRPLTQAIFDEDIINRSQPAVLLFGANWSGAAEIMQGISERIANESDHSINFFYIDIDQMPGITQFFGVSSVPTIVFIRRGEVVNKVQGLLSASKLKRLVAQAFN